VVRRKGRKPKRYSQVARISVMLRRLLGGATGENWPMSCKLRSARFTEISERSRIQATHCNRKMGGDDFLRASRGWRSRWHQ
jgi:hypothetical protein